MTSNGDSTRGGTSAQENAEAAEVAQKIKAQGQRIVSEAKSAALDEASSRKDAAAGYVSAMASALDCGAQELKRQGQQRSASLVGNAADSVSSFAEQVAARQPSELLGEVQNFARRNPALFFGATFLAGFGAVRFLKSSRDNDSDGPSAGRTPGQRPQTSAGGQL